MIICLDQRTGRGCGAENPDGAERCGRCGQSLRYALHLHNPGTQVHQYHIMRIIGYGSFGAVYQAEDTRQPGVVVALKEAFNPDDILGFQRELDALQHIRHPNLPAYHEAFEANENGYLVMEFVPGQSLEDVQAKQQGPLLESQVLGYALQICDVLHHLHSQQPPIIHRDIKPANIRLTPEGLIKLVDFGLLKLGSQQTASITRGGTPLYAALEQWSGGTDARSDVYGLGATLYHLMTGKVPIAPADRVVDALDPLPLPRQVNPQLSSHVADAIARAMSLFQKDRYPDILSFKWALMGMSQTTAALPQPPTIPAQQVPVSPQPHEPGQGLFASIATEQYQPSDTLAARSDVPYDQPTTSSLFADLERTRESQARAWREAGRCEKCGTELTVFDKLQGATRCERHRDKP